MSLITPVKFLRKKCRTCKRQIIEKELTAGICAACWKLRSEAYGAGKFELSDFFNGTNYLCFECGLPVIYAGYLHWVIDANRFALFCIRCSDNKFQKDEQHRNTKFAFTTKLQ